MKLTKTTLKMKLLEAPTRISSVASAYWTIKSILLSLLHSFPLSFSPVDKSTHVSDKFYSVLMPRMRKKPWIWGHLGPNPSLLLQP